MFTFRELCAARLAANVLGYSQSDGSNSAMKRNTALDAAEHMADVVNILRLWLQCGCSYSNNFTPSTPLGLRLGLDLTPSTPTGLRLGLDFTP